LVVPAGGIEPTGQVEIAQVTDSIKRQKRSNRQKRVSRLRGGYAETLQGILMPLGIVGTRNFVSNTKTN
jgi:hypothetical protein